MKKRVVGRHEAAARERMRTDYLDQYGRARAARRAREIAALPTVTWKGHTLYTLRCQGDFGRGPHDMHVPESLLWSLITLQRYRCPYHR